MTALSTPEARKRYQKYSYINELAAWKPNEVKPRPYNVAIPACTFQGCPFLAGAPTQYCCGQSGDSDDFGHQDQRSEGQFQPPGARRAFTDRPRPSRDARFVGLNESGKQPSMLGGKPFSDQQIRSSVMQTYKQPPKSAQTSALTRRRSHTVPPKSDRFFRQFAPAWQKLFHVLARLVPDNNSTGDAGSGISGRVSNVIVGPFMYHDRSAVVVEEFFVQAQMNVQHLDFESA